MGAVQNPRPPQTGLMSGCQRISRFLRFALGLGRVRRALRACGLVAATLLLASASAVPARAQPIQFADPSNGTYGWYGTTVGMLLFNFEIPGTLPASKWYTDYQSAPAPGRYEGQGLSQSAAFHNAYAYGDDLFLSNISRTFLWQQYVGGTVKEGGPFTGRAVSSLRFWEWVEIGQQALKTYGKIRSIMIALKSGHIEINAWRLMPKIGAFDEDDPDAPALVLSIVPASEGPLAMLREMTNWSDPRYRLKNKVNLSNLKGLVPSLAVKPSFFGALAQMPGASGDKVMTAMGRNMHELRTSLSMLKRGVAGGAESPYKRWNAVTRAEGLTDLLKVQQSTWGDITNTVASGIALVDPVAAGSWAGSARIAMGDVSRLQQALVRDQLARRGVDDWAARAVDAEMNSMVYGLESQDYMEFIDNVEEMIETGASSKVHVAPGEEALAELRIEAADAAVNKLIRDELRAIRQLYAMKARRELDERLAPNIALGLNALKEATNRLALLNQRLTSLQRGQSATRKVLTPQAASKILSEPFTM